MNTFVDCPKCGSEFIVDDEIAGLTLRCPDCLQWMNSHDDMPAYEYASSYSSSYSDQYDNYGYQSGYDY